jgi:hypothetical protein
MKRPGLLKRYTPERRSRIVEYAAMALSWGFLLFAIYNSAPQLFR